MTCLLYTSCSSLIANVNFVVNEGETLGIIGPAGGNKTVLLELLYGFLRKKSGSMLLDGVPIQIRHQMCIRDRLRSVNISDAQSGSLLDSDRSMICPVPREILALIAFCADKKECGSSRKEETISPMPRVTW